MAVTLPNVRISLSIPCAFAVALVVAILAGASSAQGQTFTTLYAFSGGTDGEFPAAGLVRDSAGNLYGTTLYGGNLSAVCLNGTGCGTVFKVAPNGVETVLYAFNGGSDGGVPESPVIRDAKGNLYGTTVNAGDFSACDGIGCGTVFKLTPHGGLSVLHTFTGGLDGENPFSIVEDAAANLYGATSGGGSYTYGTLFKIDASGRKTVLHSFGSGADGGDPVGSPILDSAGNVLGTTVVGGSLGFGTVYKLDRTGNETVLYSFTAASGDGYQPRAGLIAYGPNLYGVTLFGGDLSCMNGDGCGIVFKLDKSGNETVVHTFTGLDGSEPIAPLIRDPAGNLYGTTSEGGSYGYGTVFKIDSTGGFSVLHNFSNGRDGGFPAGGLVRDAAGNLYGTTEDGGLPGFGTVFKISN